MTLTRSAGILAFYGILAFLPKCLIRNQIRFFQFIQFFLDFRIPQLWWKPLPQLVMTGLLKLRPQSPRSWSKQIAKDHLLGYYKRAKHPSSAANIWQNYCCPHYSNQLGKGNKNCIETRISVSLFFPPGLQVAAGIICMQCCACTYPNSYGSLIPGQHTLF